MTGKEVVIHNLETASLQQVDNSIELETASQISVENVLVLDIASLNKENKTLEKASLDKTEKYKVFIRKIVNKVRELRREKNLDTASLKSANSLEIAKIQENADTKIEFYKTNAVELVKRRDVLGKFGEELSNEKIMDDDAFALAKSEKDNALLKASMNSGIEIVGDKSQTIREDPELNRLRNEIDKKAFK